MTTRTLKITYRSGPERWTTVAPVTHYEVDGTGTLYADTADGQLVLSSATEWHIKPKEWDDDGY